METHEEIDTERKTRKIISILDLSVLFSVFERTRRKQNQYTSRCGKRYQLYC